MFQHDGNEIYVPSIFELIGGYWVLYVEYPFRLMGMHFSYLTYKVMRFPMKRKMPGLIKELDEIMAQTFDHSIEVIKWMRFHYKRIVLLEHTYAERKAIMDEIHEVSKRGDQLAAIEDKKMDELFDRYHK